MSGFSDRPFTVPKDAEVFNDIFEAKYVADYLEEYVDNHVYEGESLRDRIRLNFTVGSIDKVGGIWVVNGASKTDGQKSTFKSKKVIVATGTTSDANMPILSGQETFGGQVVHQKDFGEFMRAQPSPGRRKIAILGGGKSAADIVYTCAKAGNEVSWIIRESGEGPGAFTNPAENAKGPFLNDPELAGTRFFGTLSPSCFNQPNWWTRIIHGTATGQNIIDGVFAKADQKCKSIGNFKHRPGALEGFDKLESNINLFWCTGPFGMIQRPDFWDIVSKNVHVYLKDISHLSASTIHLKHGLDIPMDVIICATGFKNDFPFFTEQQHIDLGLPHSKNVENDEEKAWDILEAEAEARVLVQYPRLRNPPQNSHAPDFVGKRTPNRLYNCIAPLSDTSIAFVGNVYVPNGFRVAEVQAIWATALLSDNIKLPSEHEMRKDIAWVNAFDRKRYPTHGHLGNYLHYDMMGYIDRLLGQVRLESHRKGWWADLVYPFITKDLVGTKEEFIRKYVEEEGELKKAI
jgi:dimethylaniline monooxygenase (N-oxide forming)